MDTAQLETCQRVREAARRRALQLRAEALDRGIRAIRRWIGQWLARHAPSGRRPVRKGRSAA